MRPHLLLIFFTKLPLHHTQHDDEGVDYNSATDMRNEEGRKKNKIT